MNNQRAKVYCQRDRMWGDNVEFRIAKPHGQNEYAVAQPIQWKVFKENEATYDPACFALRNDEAQALMDELWNVGFRPIEGTGSAGAMAATQAHLKDLQRLVFKEKAAPSH